MLEILKEMMEYWDEGTPIHSGAEVVIEARHLIARAEGKKP
jgi:hypothetical protein